MTVSTISDDIARAIGASAATQIEPPVVIRARPVVDLSGEALRARLCIFSGTEGTEYCLRPDMTTAIAGLVANRERPAARYRYDGLVFRLSDDPTEGVEFRQTGFEWFEGDEDSTPTIDAEAIQLGLSALAQCPEERCVLTVGDVALFGAVIDSMSLPGTWPARLKRAFSSLRGPVDLLKAAAANADAPDQSSLNTVLAAVSETEAEDAFRNLLQLMGAQQVGIRRAGDVISRLRERAATAPIPSEKIAALEEFLSIDTPLTNAVAVLKKFGKRSGLSFTKQIDRLERTLAILDNDPPPHWREGRFRTRATHRFDYYDGLVFELAASGKGPKPILAGGRYDGLVSRLSGGEMASRAIGVAIRPDRALECIQ